RDAKDALFKPPRVRLSEKVLKAFAITEQAISEAKPPGRLRELPPQLGTVNYDIDTLYSIRPRFAGEVAQITVIKRPPIEALAPPRAYADGKRPLAVGDLVQEGDLLAVIYSKDIGEKKGALVDAIIDWRLETDRLERYTKLLKQGAIPEATYLEQKNRVE